jgi:hypothetical protein
MSEKMPQQQVAQADIDFAVNLLNKGETAESVHGKLVERGLTPEVASALLNDLFVQAVYNEAITLLNQRHSPEQVKRQLVDRGLEKTVAASVVDEILARHRAALQEEESKGAKPLLRFLGGIMFVVGIGLFIGNRTGAFPTFPFAGFIVMAIGGAIYGAGKVS